MKNLKTIYCLIIIAALISGMSAKSYAAGSIGGTVSDVNSGNISDARVFAILDSNTVGTDLTDDDGTYVIIGLDANTYEVHVNADGYEFRIETDVVVTDGNNTIVDINNLDIEGIIKGKVLQPGGTTGIAGAYVSAYNDGNCLTSELSDANGCYTIYNLPAATYTVTVLYGVPDYDFSDRENVVASAGNTTSDIDFTGTVHPTGKISGTVTESDGTTVIAEAYVLAMDSADDLAAFETSDANGNYELDGLATGTYAVTASRNTGGQIAKIDVSVTDGSTASQDLSSASGSISGTVKNSSQTAVQGAILTAMKDGKIYKSTSDSSGNYTIQFLPAGDYQLSVDPNNNDYMASKINDVTVVANQQTSGQDFVLSGPGGKITGTITDSSGPIKGAFVMAIEPNDANDDPNTEFVPAQTSADGTYTISHLRSSAYYTIVVSADGYVSDSETNVSVTAGQTTSGKNFSLGTSGGTISGTVYKSDGQTAIENAMVQCSCPAGKSFASAMSDSGGHYSLQLLQAGTYQLFAYAEGYESENLNDVVVTGTSENSGNDFTLDEE